MNDGGGDGGMSARTGDTGRMREEKEEVDEELKGAWSGLTGEVGVRGGDERMKTLMLGIVIINVY